MSRRQHSRHHPRLPELDVPAKVNRILNLFLIIMILLIMRLWQLSILQHDERLENSRRPQQRVIIEPAERATIRDRFNTPLAINKVQYHAAISYWQIRQIPTAAWEPNAQGKRVKHFKRKEHIQNLSELLSKELNLDAGRIEDLIYAKGPLFDRAPLLVKEDITEQEYYRLKMLAKDWLGLHPHRAPRRYYPLEKVGAHVIGYMGAISSTEYQQIMREKSLLEDYVTNRDLGVAIEPPTGYSSHVEARRRLRELQERAYSFTDFVGKGGVEAFFDEHLRGFYGKKSFYSDAYGNFLRELPGARAPVAGQRVLLTISSELQDFAEQLLAENEKIRDRRSFQFNRQGFKLFKQPFLKGGSIIAMDPNTGEILAFASYPRFNPNDFIPSGDPDTAQKKRAAVHRWLEIDEHIASLWDQKQLQERELFSTITGRYATERTEITWDNYLNIILPLDNPARKALDQFNTLSHANTFQTSLETLLSMSEQTDARKLIDVLYSGPEHIPYYKTIPSWEQETILQNISEAGAEGRRHKKTLDLALQRIPSTYNKVLLLDLYRIALDASNASPEALAILGNEKISNYKTICAAASSIGEAVYGLTKPVFQATTFAKWREENEKSFLQEKRTWETATKHYRRPYTDYLTQQEQMMFRSFWAEHRCNLILAFLMGSRALPEAAVKELAPYLESIDLWQEELAAGAHQAASWHMRYKQLRGALAKLPPTVALEYLGTMRSFYDLTRPLLATYPHLKNAPQNNGTKLQQEKHLAAAFYPMHGFGYTRSHAYREAAQQGSIFKLVTSYEALRQRYLKLNHKNPSIAELNPFTVIDNLQPQTADRDKWNVGSTLEGKAIPQYYKGGRLPRSQHHNIGKVDLIGALAVSSNVYFALVAGEVLDTPESLIEAARSFSYGSQTGIDLPGEYSGCLPKDLAVNRTGLYATAIGQHSLVSTPLQCAVMMSTLANGGKVLKPKIVKTIIGVEPTRNEELTLYRQEYPYKESLALAGIHFSLFTAADSRQSTPQVTIIPTEVKREIFLPAPIRNVLLQGMRQVVLGAHGTARKSVISSFSPSSKEMRNYVDLQEQIVGKTSTSEIVERIDCDQVNGTHMYTHIWFSAISFTKNKGALSPLPTSQADLFSRPELVVVVYLRYGDYGKEAAPLATQMIKKWRDIKAKQPQ